MNIMSKLQIQKSLQKLHARNIITDEQLAGLVTILYQNKKEDFFKINKKLFHGNRSIFAH